MSYTNSPLVDCQVLSPNHSGQRTHEIDTIIPHVVVGQLTAEGIGYCFDDPSTESSCNYAIGTDGRVCLVVDEANRSWCSSNRAIDQRGVTIECASDKTHPYAVNDKVYNKLINLCVDICKRNGKTKLLWFADKDKTLDYLENHIKKDEMVIAVHRWFANKACPGEYLYNRLDEFAAEVTKRLNNGNVKKIQYTKYSKDEFIEKVASCVNAIRTEFGIEVASPIIAQACLESDYGTTNKATHNNYFGLKYRENRCPSACGTFVDGSQEQLENGQFVPITDQWFEFETLEKGIRGYFEYISIDRYKELKGEKDPKKYLEKIKAAGYATDLEYVSKVYNVITKWDLTKYDPRDYLMKGDKGSEVKVMQEGLIYLGYDLGTAGADGDFGNKTDAAVCAFQSDNGLVVDGKYGPLSKAKLENAVANKEDATAYNAIYRVQVGAFKNRSYAETRLQEVKAHGYADAFINTKDGMHKVQVGAYSIKDNATKCVDGLKKLGYTDAFIA